MPQHKLGRLASIWSVWILPGSCAKFVKTLVLIQIRRLAQSLRASWCCALYRRLIQKLASPIKTTWNPTLWSKWKDPWLQHNADHTRSLAMSRVSNAFMNSPMHHMNPMSLTLRICETHPRSHPHNYHAETHPENATHQHASKTMYVLCNR